jgi:hypothetical protein
MFGSLLLVWNIALSGSFSNTVNQYSSVGLGYQISYTYRIAPPVKAWIVAYRTLKYVMTAAFHVFQFTIHKYLFILLYVTVAVDKVTFITKQQT